MVPKPKINYVIKKNRNRTCRIDVIRDDGSVYNGGERHKVEVVKISCSCCGQPLIISNAPIITRSDCLEIMHNYVDIGFCEIFDKSEFKGNLFAKISYEDAAISPIRMRWRFVK
jgi:hypothetical protein